MYFILLQASDWWQTRRRLTSGAQLACRVDEAYRVGKSTHYSDSITALHQLSTRSEPTSISVPFRLLVHVGYNRLKHNVEFEVTSIHRIVSPIEKDIVQSYMIALGQTTRWLQSLYNVSKSALSSRNFEVHEILFQVRLCMHNPVSVSIDSPNSPSFADPAFTFYLLRLHILCRDYVNPVELCLLIPW